jgi:hypothetical protein
MQFGLRRRAFITLLGGAAAAVVAKLGRPHVTDRAESVVRRAHDAFGVCALH